MGAFLVGVVASINRFYFFGDLFVIFNVLVYFLPALFLVINLMVCLRKLKQSEEVDQLTLEENIEVFDED